MGTSLCGAFQLSCSQTLEEGSLAGATLVAFRLMHIFLKGLILAQNERWRRGLGMQVEREVTDGDFGQRL